MKFTTERVSVFRGEGLWGGLCETLALRSSPGREVVLAIGCEEADDAVVCVDAEEFASFSDFLTQFAQNLNTPLNGASFKLAIACVTLRAQYDNMGEPFREGVRITIDHHEGAKTRSWSVFLAESALHRLAARCRDVVQEQAR